ncbi:MAG: hypothetical protein GWN79_26055, partial [Actinobacteria bacterium]|nr:hypothetical protein [Actinomycetota bacterium]NIS36350.1 hypothetical protein [Actinomycetota bacterium]NIU22299.1 hypothetical protein [Actinomycetota bacterium]NIU70879.1 hypothetical protein [Actinomycetota bacterium]NIW32804.1 hypothetical protein [Actinomycetota bacterium]
TARSAADAGLALWRGRPFLGTGDLPALQPVVTRLEEIRLVLLEERLAADLALGRHAAVIGEIEELLEQHPWREGLWASLMTALVRSGRQTEALRAYQRAKRMLGDEMGIEPSSELRELEERILMQDTAPAPAPGRSVRSYELHEKVGEAPTGEVFRARQTGTGRDVALTIAGAEWADDPTFIRTFETGARVLSAVEHPHSAPVLDFWREPGRAVLARPWLSGGSLADRARP